MNSHPHLKASITKRITEARRSICLLKCMWQTVLILFGAFFSANVPAQSLLLQFQFEDTGVTTTDSVSGVTLNITNAAGAPADLHGALGTGVAGVGRALDFTSATAGTGNNPIAATMGNTTIAPGSLGTNFTVTFWIKPTGALNNTRFFGIGTNGVTDIGSANSLGILGNGNYTSCQMNVSTYNTGGQNVALTQNQWNFVAYTYSGTNVVLYSGSQSAPVSQTAAISVTTAGAVNLGSMFDVFIGNRPSNRQRGAPVYYDDVRLYQGTANQSFLDAVRSSATNVPNPFATGPSVSPSNTVYAGTLVTLSASSVGTQPLTNYWQTDGGSDGITWTNLPVSNTNVYSLDTSALPPGNYQYRLTVSNAVGSYEGYSASVTVLAASGPIILANTTITPSTAPVGGSAVLSASYAGTLPIYYQWLFTNTNGVTSYVPGATSNVFTLSNIQFANAGSYSLMASNNPNGVPTVVTNTPAVLTVRLAVIVATSSTAPSPGPNDIAQLSSVGDTKFPGTNALNYYDNNGTPPGQTFTTGSNPSGYSINGLYYLAGGPVVSDGSHPAGVTYTLRLYSVSGTAATLLSTYVNDNTAPAVPNNTWVEWTGALTNILAPNTTYAYSIRSGSGFMHMGNASNSPAFYNGGLGVFPAGSGTITFAGPPDTSDATFMVNLITAGSLGTPIASISPSSSQTNPIYGGVPVTLSGQVNGPGPIYYDWQTDNGLGGGFSDIPGANGTTYVINTTNMASGTYNYQLIATNSAGAVTSAPVTLYLAAASAPVVSTNTTITPSATFIGGSVVMRAAFVGTPAITYQWEFDNGSGPVPIPGATNTTFTIASAQLSNNGSYFLSASNGITPYTNSSSPEPLTVATPPATNAVGAGIFDGGSSAPPVGAYDIAQLESVPPSVDPGINYYVDNSAPPGQTFTTGSTPPAGHSGYPLNSIWLQEELSTVGSGGNTPQTYTLGIYTVTGTNATLITSYVSSNMLGIVEGDWIQWVGLTNILQTNTTYAFSIHRNGIGWWKVANDGGQNTDLYTNGQAALLPASGAGGVTYSTDPTIDAAFLISLTPPGPPVPLQSIIKPANCYAGNPVTMEAVFSGSTPISYQWQFTDTNGVGPVNIAGATNFFYSILSVAHSNAGTYSCLASNGFGVSNSAPVTLTVPVPPTYFVSDYSYSTFNSTVYGGPGVIGAGTFWNTIDTTGGNQTSFADDGSTDLSLGFTSTRTWDFANSFGIPLLDYYMLNQGSGQTTFGLNNLPNGVYNLVVYSCDGHYEYSQTAITIGNVTQDILTTSDSEFVPGMNYTVFTNIVVTNGTINATWQKAGTVEAALNGVQVELGYSLENPAVNITTQPTNVVVATGQPASFSVVAYGPPPLTYQWRANGSPINGATNSVLAFSPPSAGDTVPSYDVVVSSPSSGLSATSSVVTLTIRSSIDNLVWRGYGLKWDLASANWADTTASIDPANFQQGDNVLLDNTAAGNGNVYLIGRVMPSSVTIANTNYTFFGPGYLSWNMGLHVTGTGRLTLTTANDYTGTTTLDAGTTLALSGIGSIANSTGITLGAGATLNVSGRNDGVLLLNPAQTLSGSGTYNVSGAVLNNGTLELNVNKTAGVVTNDLMQGMSSITYGGTLQLNLSGDALAAGDTMKLFNATTYSGAFVTIVPASPGTGLVWNTSTLVTSGTLSVASAVNPVNTTPTNIVFSVTGSDLTLSWPADHTGWRLQAQTNPPHGGLGTNWFDVVGANATNQEIILINPTAGSVFFRMVYP